LNPLAAMNPPRFDKASKLLVLEDSQGSVRDVMKRDTYSVVGRRVRKRRRCISDVRLSDDLAKNFSDRP